MKEKKMCDLCDNPCECTHPVSFHGHLDEEGNPPPKEIQQYIGLGSYLDDTEAGDAMDEYWENCARLCHDCMNKYAYWITWFG